MIWIYQLYAGVITWKLYIEFKIFISIFKLYINYKIIYKFYFGLFVLHECAKVLMVYCIVRGVAAWKKLLR